MYDFIDLKLIRLISEETSLSAVAVRAKMSLPAVSQRLSKLESALKTKLVFRAGPFGLTAEGEIMLASAGTILDELDQLDSRLRRHREARNESLRLACTDGVLLSHLPAPLKVLMQERPSLRLEIDDVAEEVAYRLLTGDQVDIVLVPEGHSRDFVTSTRYRSERVCLIAPLRHPIGQEIRPIPLEAAAQFQFVGLYDRYSPIEKLCVAAGIRLDTSVRVSTAEAQCQLISQSFNLLALAYESAARRHARTQAINVIRLLDEWAVVHFVAATYTRTASAPPARRFLQLLASEHVP